jgi:lipoprotein-releasing system permease protein
VFNGLEDLLRSLNNSFDPQIKIEAVEGKSFPITKELTHKVSAIPGVKIVTEVIEDYAYARYRYANQIVTIKGVSDNFIDQQRIPKENIVDGNSDLIKEKVPYAIVGQGVSNSLSIAPVNNLFPLQLYYIKNLKAGSIDPNNFYSQRNILVGGIFSIVQNLDDNYIIVPLNFAQELLNYGNKRTSLEIKVDDQANLKQVQENLKKTLGKNFSVLNPEEQHKDLYKLLKMEKLFTFLALTLLLAIGSLNIFFSLMMLALDKQKDISVLTALGADQRLIRNIFLAEGALISLTGAFTGLIIGGALCWAQGTYGLLSMGMESSITEGYPVKIVMSDFISILLVVLIITFLISFRPAILASRYASLNRL